MLSMTVAATRCANAAAFGLPKIAMTTFANAVSAKNTAIPVRTSVITLSAKARWAARHTGPKRWNCLPFSSGGSSVSTCGRPLRSWRSRYSR